jgi:hypothetical protein
MTAGASYQRQRAVVDSLVREMHDGLPGSAAPNADHAARHLGGGTP